MPPIDPRILRRIAQFVLSRLPELLGSRDCIQVTFDSEGAFTGVTEVRVKEPRSRQVLDAEGRCVRVEDLPPCPAPPCCPPQDEPCGPAPSDHD